MRKPRKRAHLALVVISKEWKKTDGKMGCLFSRVFHNNNGKKPEFAPWLFHV